jgi:hypothetical protein
MEFVMSYLTILPWLLPIVNSLFDYIGWADVALRG